MSEEILESYFRWLYYKIFRVWDLESPYSYVQVCTHMHSVVFNDSVPNDDNRSGEGEELRDEFVSTLPMIDAEDYAKIHSLGKASILETLIGLSYKADFMVERGPDTWFMTFLKNLGLTESTDAKFRITRTSRVKRILWTFNERQYLPSGKGGLFPLKRPKEDQRLIEIWYQMAAWITENKLY